MKTHIAPVILVLVLALAALAQSPAPPPEAAKPPGAKVVAKKDERSATTTYSVVFAWDAYVQPNSITGFTLYEHTGGTTYVSVGNITPAIATTFTLDNVSAAVHSYVLTAVNSTTGGESAQSNEVTVNVPAPPSAPANLRATVAASSP